MQENLALVLTNGGKKSACFIFFSTKFLSTSTFHLICFEHRLHSFTLAVPFPDLTFDIFTRIIFLLIS